MKDYRLYILNSNDHFVAIQLEDKDGNNFNN